MDLPSVLPHSKLHAHRYSCAEMRWVNTFGHMGFIRWMKLMLHLLQIHMDINGNIRAGEYRSRITVNWRGHA